MLHILIVEDEYIVLKGLESILTEQDQVQVSISLATNAIDALDVIKKEQPEVILTDINMPEMDGLTFIQEAKKILPNCAFLVISGYENLDYLKRAISLHVNAYLLKPVDTEELLQKLVQINDEKREHMLSALSHLKMQLLYGTQEQFLSPDEASMLFPRKRLAFYLCLPLEEQSVDQLSTLLSHYFYRVYMIRHQGKLT